MSDCKRIESIVGHYYGVKNLGLYHDSEYDDIFCFYGNSSYPDVYEQAKTRMACEIRNQIRADMKASVHTATLAQILILRENKCFMLGLLSPNI